MGRWTCPDPSCVYDAELRAGERCPICGAEAEDFDFRALGELLKEKWGVAKLKKQERDVEQVMKHVKFCPKCGSTDVFWASGLPQFWSTWECRRCGYRGQVILEDSKTAVKLRENYRKKKISK